MGVKGGNLGFTLTLITLLKDGGGKGGRSKNDTCVALTKFKKNTDVFFSLNLGFTLFCYK